MDERLRNYDLNLNTRSSLTLRYTEGAKTLEPDLIIFSDEPVVVALGDIKYIENENIDLERSSMFQVNAYMDGYGLNKSFLIHPTSGDFASRSYPLRWGHEITVYKVPVNSEQAFINAIDRIIEKESCLPKSKELRSSV